MLLKTEISSDVGCVRANNEDMILCGGDFFRNRSSKQIVELSDTARFAAIVADGMGGHGGGEFASKIALDNFDDFILHLLEGLNEDEIASSLKRWVDETHRLILKKSNELPGCEGMGSTFCGLLFLGEMVFALNVGDSRLYRFRGGILKQLTTDHSIRQLTGDSSQDKNMIYNSLGGGESAFLDIKNLSGQMLTEDMYLICSDGLSDMLPDEETERILNENPSAEALITAAKNGGGRDNVSVILLKIIG